MENRRRKQRYGARLKGHLRIEGFCFAVETENLSVTGARIVLDSPLLEGAAVELILSACINGATDTTQLTMTGVVVWCTEDMDAGFQAGIRFDGISESHREYLKFTLPSYTPV